MRDISGLNCLLKKIIGFFQNLSLKLPIGMQQEASPSCTWRFWCRFSVSHLWTIPRKEKWACLGVLRETTLSTPLLCLHSVTWLPDANCWALILVLFRSSCNFLRNKMEAISLENPGFNNPLGNIGTVVSQIGSKVWWLPATYVASPNWKKIITPCVSILFAPISLLSCRSKHSMWYLVCVLYWVYFILELS